MSNQLEIDELLEIGDKIKVIVEGMLFPKGGDTFCRLHDPSLYDEDENAHNCMGCNLNDYAVIFLNAVSPRAHYGSKFDLFSNFILHAYVIVERIQVFTKLMGISGQDFAQRYPSLQEVRKWANFIKHPKAFMLVHHPEYSYAPPASAGDKLVIDYDFILTYYSDNTNNAQLFNLLKNATNVVVVMPDPVQFAAAVCYEYHEFVEYLLSDKAARDIIKDHTTVEAFFSSEAVDPEADTVA